MSWISANDNCEEKSQKPFPRKKRMSSEWSNIKNPSYLYINFLIQYVRYHMNLKSSQLKMLYKFLFVVLNNVHRQLIYSPCRWTMIKQQRD